jgi:predicted adenine nucleotide alpha hydrolase (AANH) superfamily ATPase
MNILLANMPVEFNKRENLEPPLGICYLGAILKDIKGVKIYLKDYELSPFREEMFREDLSKFNIDVLGVSFRTASYRSAKKFIRKAKDIKKDIYQKNHTQKAEKK